jgi:hypothetical protein
MLVLALVGCVHQVSWTIDPVASVRLPSTDVAVVAGDRSCRALADALVDALGSRPGIDVRPSSAQRITVSGCDDEVTTTLDIEGNYPGLVYGNTVYTEQRRYSVHGWARGEMRVDLPGGTAGEALVFRDEVERALRGAWVQGGDLDLPASAQLRERLAAALADKLADRVAPLPETLRRTIFPDPEPGTARQLHNDAVAAEKSGNLEDALRLARAAYAADPSPGAMDYLEEVRDHAASVGYAFRTP